MPDEILLRILEFALAYEKPVDNTPLLFCRLARFENTSPKICQLVHEAFFRVNTFVVRLPELPKFHDRSEAEWCQRITQPLEKASRATTDVYALQDSGFRFLHCLPLARTWLRRIELRPTLLVTSNMATMFEDSGWKLLSDFGRHSRHFNGIQYIDLALSIQNNISYSDTGGYDDSIIDNLIQSFCKALEEKKITIWAGKLIFNLVKHEHVAWQEHLEWREEIEDLMGRVEEAIYEGFEVKDPE